MTPPPRDTTPPPDLPRNGHAPGAERRPVSPTARSELLTAIRGHQCRNGRPFLTWDEVREIVQGLGHIRATRP